MAKTVTTDELILDALQRLLASPIPLRLHGSKARPGVFLGSSAAAKAAAQRCLDGTLISAAGSEKIARSSVTLYHLTAAGLAHLLVQAPGPKLLAAVLEGVQRVAECVAGCRQSFERVTKTAENLERAIESAVARIRPPDVTTLLQQSPAVKSTDSTAAADAAVLAALAEHKRQSPIAPAKLPDLFRRVHAEHVGLTIGRFHDTLRRLAGDKKLRLLPFTQALYQLTEPEYALLMSREVLFYAESA